MTHDERVGSAAEEAVKLLSAFAAHAAEVASQVNHNVDDHLATGAPECTYCPICRTVHIAREASPEVRAHLATAAASLMQAAASVLSAAAHSGPARPEPGGVERIDLDDAEGWPDEAAGPDDSSDHSEQHHPDHEEDER